MTTFVIGHTSKKDWIEGYAAGLSTNPYDEEFIAETYDDCPLDKVYVVGPREAEKIRSGFV